MINRPPLYGDLRIQYRHDDELRHPVRSAGLVDPTDMRPASNSPKSLDVQFIGMSPTGFIFAGFERLDGAHYAQAWQVANSA